MAAITAGLVKDLRERTGAGMMDCKKALSQCDGDIEKAIDFLREKGLAAAAKKAGRVAAEGLVEAYVDDKIAVLVEVNCETDFVAKTDNFKALVSGVAKHIAKNNPASVEALADQEYEAGKTVSALITESIAKIGENISIRRFVRYELPSGTLAGSYIHGGGRIGVVVELEGGDAALAKDIAMHVAAANPSYLERSQVPTAELDHEKEVLSEQARNEGKPDKIIEKMVIGRIQKFYKEVCLVDQEYVKDPDKTIAALLKEHNATIKAYTRYQLGEGIEKKVENFAEEVMSFVK